MTITNEDNMQLMARYEDNHFDLAIVDPPYGLGMGGSLNVNSKVNYENKTWDTEIPSNEYFDELKRISKNQIVWGGNYFGYLWQVGCKGFICWNKLNHHDNRADVEMAWTSFNKLAKYVEYMWDGNRYGTKGNIKGVGQPKIRIHPTQKPIALMLWCLEKSKTTGAVLDPFLGSGTTAVACERLKRKWIGIEIEERYCEIAAKRIEAERRQLKLF
jgi:site-specific DNA-methyltransferase (adenine-specific)